MVEEFSLRFFVGGTDDTLAGAFVVGVASRKLWPGCVLAFNFLHRTQPIPAVRHSHNHIGILFQHLQSGHVQ